MGGLPLVCWICLVVGIRALLLGQSNTRTTYRAAVSEYAVVTPVTIATNHSQAVEQMMVNLREFENQANLAGAMNVDIMVLPEYGIYGLIRDRTDMSHYIENIPDVPHWEEWVPCDDHKRYPQRLDVIVFLSCLAKSNMMYIVANYGDAKPCLSEDPNCPDDGQYQYNTNIVFDRKGALIARYHKQNLFYENQFNEPITPEYVFFDTSFGRFGTFTCFDILFHEPIIPLITKYNITDVAFPTAWMDVMPFYSAIGYHSSVASAYHVNLLAANVHLPMARFQGSGIYTPEGANAFYYSKTSLYGKLLISDVDMIQRTGQLWRPHSIQGNQGPKLHSNLDTAKSVIFNDWYETVLLNDSISNVTVCQRGLCCSLEYHHNGPLKDQYAFGVFNGRHIAEGEYYLQICVLFRCESDDIKSCGKTIFTANTAFQSVKMSGSFETPYVTPQIVLTDNGSLRLPKKGTMKFTDGELTGTDNSYPLLEACMFGRFYERD